MSQCATSFFFSKTIQHVTNGPEPNDGSLRETMRPKEIRTKAGKSLDWVAVYAGVSRPTARLYEADENGVVPRCKAALDKIYAELKAGLVEA
jgi:hypothetical protein